MRELPADPELRGYLYEAIEAQAQLRAAEEEATQQRELFRAAVARSHEAGASHRVIAAALGITYGRVQQILAMSQPPSGGA